MSRTCNENIQYPRKVGQLEHKSVPGSFLKKRLGTRLTQLSACSKNYKAKGSICVGSPMKKSDFHRSNRTPIQCMQAIDLYVKTTKRAMLTLSFLAEK